MRHALWTAATMLALAPALAHADPAPSLAGAPVAQLVAPALTLQPEPESVYAPPAPPSETEGVNNGAIHLDTTLSYFNDFVYRGVNYSRVGGNSNATNFQVDSEISFDLGKLPHPFAGVFANVYDADPVSRFQEIRPYVGADLTLKPLTFSAGFNAYIYPEREDFNTSEVFTQIQLDDSRLWHADQPVLNPYIYAAYDYQFNNGWYFQAGISHDFFFEDWGVTLTPVADIGITDAYQTIFVFTTDKASGFHHYDIGLIAKYSLNALLNLSRRYGQWSANGYLYYTSPLREDNEVESVLWGGAGIELRY